MAIRLGLSLLAASLLMGCAQNQNSPQEKILTPVSIPNIGSAVSHAQTINPTVVTSTVEPKPILYLCITSRPSGWPVDQSINAWNANGKNLFTLDANNKCRDFVSFKLVTSKIYEGETEFLKNGIEVRLNQTSNVKLHTLCHELGHVLGLPHNQDPRSCMNIQRTVTTPSTMDIENVGKQYWIKEESARHAAGQ